MISHYFETNNCTNNSNEIKTGGRKAGIFSALQVL